MRNDHDTAHDDRFMFLEIKAEQIRKMLLGSLLLAKDAWKDVFLRTPEGLRVLKTVDEASEEFIDRSLSDPVAKLDDVLGVINRPAHAPLSLCWIISHSTRSDHRYDFWKKK